MVIAGNFIVLIDLLVSSRLVITGFSFQLAYAFQDNSPEIMRLAATRRTHRRRSVEGMSFEKTYEIPWIEDTDPYSLVVVDIAFPERFFIFLALSCFN